ncbi:NUDIX domain-containing protein [Oceanobacillus halophilus]|uniref:NUDIX domain-containing protein n=2 Tax=Oceanobacillus halophilus TaxID=930130 RepID=A0A494ZSX8_9BACI|nr:NUDIX domain-containing protein [Oceanobacillus halophilus]
MELGETFEETIQRELLEELSIYIEEIKLLHIFSGKKFYHEYPNGDQVNSVIAIYTAETYKGDIKVDHNEVKEARFFKLDSLPTERTKTTKNSLMHLNIDVNNRKTKTT